MGYTKNRNFYRVSNLQIFSPGAALWWFHCEKVMQIWVIQKKIEIFIGSRTSKFLRPAQRYDDFIAKKVMQIWVIQKIEIFIGSRTSKFLRPAQRYDDFKLKWFHCEKSRVIQKNRNFYRVSNLQIFAPGQRYDDFIAKKVMQIWVIQKIEIFIGSRTSKFLRPAQRYDDFKLIKQTSKRANEPVSPSRVFRAPGTSPYHLVPKHLRARSTFGPRGPGLSNPTSFLRAALPMAPTRDDNARDKRERPPPEPSNILKRFCALYGVKIRYYKKKVSKLNYLHNPLTHSVPFKGR